MDDKDEHANHDPTRDPDPADASAPGDMEPAAAAPPDGSPGTEPSRVTPATGPKRLLAVGAIVLGVLLVAAVAFAYVQNRTGSPDDALVAVPADAGFVLSADLRHFTEGDRFDRLLEAVEPVLGEVDPGIETFDDAVDQIDAMLEEEAGFTLTDDVLPWVGRSMAVSATDLSDDDTAGMLIAVSVRDEAAAGAFLERVAEENDTPLERRPVEGAGDDAYVTAAGGPGDEAWIVIEDGLLLASPSRDHVETALATVESGEDITGNETYGELIDELPEDRGIRLYVSGDALDAISEQAQQELDAAGDGDLGEVAAAGDFAMAVGLTDLGLAFDSVSRMGDLPVETTLVTPPLGSMLAEDTLAYLGLGAETDPPTIFGLVEELAGPGAVDVDAISGMLGVPGVGELLEHLTPRLGVAVSPRLGGMPASGTLPVDLSVILALGIDDRQAVVAAVENMVPWLETMGISVEREGDVWQAAVDPESPLAVWTVTEDSLRLATDAATLDIYDEGDGSTGEPVPEAIAELDDVLPGDGLSMFVDIDGLAGALGDPAVAEAVAGFDSAGAGVEQDEDGLVHAGMVIKLADVSGGVDALGD